MAITINNSAVTEIHLNDGSNTEVYAVQLSNGDPVWAKAIGKVYKQGYPSHVSLVTAVFESRREPTVAIGGFSSGANTYWGDVIAGAFQYDPYWRPTSGGENFSYTVTAGTAASFNIGSLAAAAERVPTTVTYNHVANLTSMRIRYTKADANGTAYDATKTASATFTDVWDGGQVVFTPTATTYWTCTESGYIAGHGDLNFTPVVSRRPRKLTYTQNTGIASTTFKYANLSAASTTTVTRTASWTSTQDMWSGAQITATPTAATYWSAPAASTFDANESDLTYTPSPSRLGRHIQYRSAYDVEVSANYTDTAGSPKTTSKFQYQGYVYTTMVTGTCWQGSDVTFNWNAKSTYTTVSSTQTTAGAATATASGDVPSVTYTTRSVTFTKNTGIASASLQYRNHLAPGSTDTKTPSTTTTYTAWAGGSITCSATASTYWSAPAATSYAAGTTAVNYSPVPTRLPRTVTVTAIPYALTNVIVKYTATSNGSAATSTFTAAGNVTNAWQGAVVEVTGMANNSNYTTVTTNTYSIATAGVSGATPNVTYVGRQLSYTKSTGISSVTIQYRSTNSPSSSTSVNPSTSTTYTVWAGSTITCTAVAQSGYEIISPNPATINPGTGAYNYAPLAAAKRTVTGSVNSRFVNSGSVVQLRLKSDNSVLPNGSTLTDGTQFRYEYTNSKCVVCNNYGWADGQTVHTDWLTLSSSNASYTFSPTFAVHFYINAGTGKIKPNGGKTWDGTINLYYPYGTSMVTGWDASELTISSTGNSNGVWMKAGTANKILSGSGSQFWAVTNTTSSEKVYIEGNFWALSNVASSTALTDQCFDYLFASQSQLYLTAAFSLDWFQFTNTTTRRGIPQYGFRHAFAGIGGGVLPQLTSLWFTGAGCAAGMFYTSPITNTATNIVVYGTITSSQMFYQMFRQTSITIAPTFRSSSTAFQNASEAFRECFYLCTNLTTPATVADDDSNLTMASNLFRAMYIGCSNLTRCQDIRNFTKMGTYSCCYMYQDCTKLTRPCYLGHVTTLAGYCFRYMFYGCTSLTLPAYIGPLTSATIPNYALQNMYQNSGMVLPSAGVRFGPRTWSLVNDSSKTYTLGTGNGTTGMGTAAIGSSYIYTNYIPYEGIDPNVSSQNGSVTISGYVDGMFDDGNCLAIINLEDVEFGQVPMPNANVAVRATVVDGDLVYYDWPTVISGTDGDADYGRCDLTIIGPNVNGEQVAVYDYTSF